MPMRLNGAPRQCVMCGHQWRQRSIDAPLPSCCPNCTSHMWETGEPKPHPKPRPETAVKRVATRRANGKPWHNTDTRQKIAQTLTGQSSTPEANAKRSAALKGRQKTPEHIARWVASRRANGGWAKSPETRQRISESKKAAWEALSEVDKAFIRTVWKAGGCKRRKLSDRNCIGCGMLLTRRQVQQGKRYHSIQCRNKNGPKRPKRCGAERACARCGLIVWVSNYRLHNWRHCSRPCRRKPLSEKAREKRQRNSPRATAWRLAVYERDGWKCVDCGSKRLLHAHHLKSWSDFPELRFDVSNGVTVCLWCHKKRHNGRYIPDRRTEGVQLPRLPRAESIQLSLDFRTSILADD